MTAAYPLEEVKERLRRDALALAQRLTPDGRMNGPNWWFRNPLRTDGGNYHTASVNVTRGIWKDFSNAGGGQGGDMLSFVCYFACGGDYKSAWRWSLDWLGLTGREPDRAYSAQLAEQARQNAGAEVARLARTRRFCLHLWLEAKPLDGHDPASLYLAGRGIDVQALAEGVPRALRFHPRVESRTERGRHFPAMLAVASLEGVPRGLATLHATLLARDGQLYAKARRDSALPSKEVSCAYAGASVRLQRGASRKRLSDAADRSSALIAEGIENALTAALACPEARVLAALSLANLARVALPDRISSVTLLADNDGDNAQARAGLERAIAAHQAAGREVYVAYAPGGAKDFNAALVAA